MTDTTSSQSTRGEISRRTFLGGSLAAAVAIAGSAVLERPGTAAAALRSQVAGRRILPIGILADVTPSGLMRITSANTPVQSLVFDTVLGADLGTLRPRPGLATAWSYDKTKTKLTVQLREGVVFHTGRPFGPEDVIYSVRQAMVKTNGDQMGIIAKRIIRMTKTGKNEVTFELEAPTSNFFNLLQISPVVDSHTFAGLASGTKVIGTGPYEWKSWKPGSSVELQRNRRYWQKGLPHFDEVILHVIPSGTALMDALRTGQVLLGWEMNSEDATLMTRGTSFKLFTDYPLFTNYYLGVNTSASPFTDVRVRQAVAYALDRERIVKQALAGYGRATCVPWATNLPGVSKADSSFYSYNPGRAQSLFKQAGSPTTPLTIAWSAGAATQQAVLNIIQYDLQNIGFRVNAQALQSATYQSQIQAASFQGIWLGSMDASGLDLATWLMGLNPFRVGDNTSHVTDPQYTQLANGVIGAVSAKQLAAATARLTRYVLDEAFHLSVAHGQHVSVRAGNLTGLESSLGENLVLTSAKLA